MHLKYTRATLAAEVAARTHLPAEDVATAIQSMVEVMAEALAAGGEVQLSTVGTLWAEDREAREAYIPRNKAHGMIEARRRYRFRAGPTLLQRGDELFRLQRKS